MQLCTPLSKHCTVTYLGKSQTSPVRKKLCSSCSCKHYPVLVAVVVVVVAVAVDDYAVNQVAVGHQIQECSFNGCLAQHLGMKLFEFVQIVRSGPRHRHERVRRDSVPQHGARHTVRAVRLSHDTVAQVREPVQN